MLGGHSRLGEREMWSQGEATHRMRFRRRRAPNGPWSLSRTYESSRQQELNPKKFVKRGRSILIERTHEFVKPRFIDGTVEYEYFKVVISHAKTVGAGSCGGCSDGATLYLASVKLDQHTGVGDYTYTQPLGRAYVTWQGGSPVPTRKSTWGAVKSLYR